MGITVKTLTLGIRCDMKTLAIAAVAILSAWPLSGCSKRNLLYESLNVPRVGSSSEDLARFALAWDRIQKTAQWQRAAEWIRDNPSNVDDCVVLQVVYLRTGYPWTEEDIARLREEDISVKVVCFFRRVWLLGYCSNVEVQPDRSPVYDGTSVLGESDRLVLSVLSPDGPKHETGFLTETERAANAAAISSLYEGLLASAEGETDVLAPWGSDDGAEIIILTVAKGGSVSCRAAINGYNSIHEGTDDPYGRLGRDVNEFLTACIRFWTGRPPLAESQQGLSRAVGAHQ